MSQRTDELQHEIEETRGRTGETAGAIGYKTDVPARARDRVGTIKDKVTGAGHRVIDATPDAGDARQGARKAAGIAQQNPLGLAAASLAAGFLIGTLLPSTRIEDERIGPMADAVKERAGEVAHEAVEHGREAASEMAGTVKEQAKETVREHGSAVAETAKEKAAEGASEARQAGSEGSPPSTTGGSEEPPRPTTGGPVA